MDLILWYLYMPKEQLELEDMAVAPGESRVTRNLPRKDCLALNNGLDRLISSSSSDVEQSLISDLTEYDDWGGPLPSESVSQVSSGCSTILLSDSEAKELHQLDSRPFLDHRA
ncbi:hypothetical protein H2198_010598 [Neophaeococcomyces mojaviensis]|uniref:Uncharacterized protein n=1 Tax=Neophaeococcomyces mojaviensis TaxID=3383035 RepID=A0ACC2ZR20_9EURO|nr:hypothetical protein H2198_010598 [Knufia sp. JES_112]